MDQQNKNSYRSILKATSVFGMMQIVKMIISVISSKFVAIYLGTIGVGLVSLLNNVLNIILAITNFEFLTTGTREVALVHDVNDSSKLSKTIATLQKMAIFIGLLGAIICLLFSKTLSNFAFGNSERQYWFMILSGYFFILSLSNARMAILQGVNNIKILALCNITSSFFIAIGSVFIYYYYRIEGIIWVVLYSSSIQLLVTIYFTRRYTFKIPSFIVKEFYDESLPIFRLGFLMSLNLIFGQICNFVIKLYLNDHGSSSQIIGYYEVSSVILINYLGLIFNAMSYDFYPKLSAISLDNEKVKQLVNNQIEIALILITPAIIFLYLSAPLVIKLLYSEEFSSSFLILKMALFSVILKAIIFPLGYVVLVKGNKKLFFRQALFSDLLNLVLSIILYYGYGLLGLGMAYVLNYLLYGIYIYRMVKKEYDFHFIKSCQKLITISLIIGILAIVIVYSFQQFYVYFLITILFILSLLFSLKGLNQRIKLKEAIMKTINKNIKE